jgi:hypothetical protein
MIRTIFTIFLGVGSAVIIIMAVISFSKHRELTDDEFNVEEFFEGSMETTPSEQEEEETKKKIPSKKKYHSPHVVDYFNEITLGSEFGYSRKNPYKWTTDVKIFIEGRKPQHLLIELDDVVSELNTIIQPIDIKIVSKRSEANLFLFLGSRFQFLSAHSEITDLPDCLGFFLTNHNEGTAFVDLVRTAGQIDFQRHILREEVTQSLGFFNDSETYKNSIFYDKYSTVTEYSKIDREIIDMLYNE